MRLFYCLPSWFAFCSWLRVGFWEKIRGLGKSLSSQLFVCFFSKFLFLYFRFLLFLFLIDKIFSNIHETTSFISGPEGISITKASTVKNILQCRPSSTIVPFGYV